MATNLTEWIEEISGEVPGCLNPIITKNVLWTCRDFCKETRLWYEKLSPIDAIATTETDIAFVSGSPCTITTSAGDFTADGWTAGDQVISNSDDNPGVYTIDSGGVATGTLTLVSTDDVLDEDATGVTLSKSSYGLSTTSGEVIEVRKSRFGGSNLSPTSRQILDQSSEPNWDKRTATTPTHFIVETDKRIRIVPMPSEYGENDIEVWVYLRPLTTATSVEDFLYEDYMETIRDGALARLFRMARQPWGDMQMAMVYEQAYESRRTDAFMKGQNGFAAKVSGGFYG